MILIDKNRTLEPPENSRFVSLTPIGSFLVALYARRIYRADSTEVIGEDFVSVYMNDMGREVGRTQHRVDFAPIAAPYVPPPVPRWYRFCNAFYMTLEGLQEMIRCLK